MTPSRQPEQSRVSHDATPVARRLGSRSGFEALEARVLWKGSLRDRVGGQTVRGVTRVDSRFHLRSVVFGTTSRQGRRSPSRWSGISSRIVNPVTVGLVPTGPCLVPRFASPDEGMLKE